tara:strand:- start:63 stop:251 length:189 start_codon:yes stop_codon:yes gene_type:complete
MYALKTKRKFAFGMAFKTEAELDRYIEQAYWTWKGIQPKGTEKTKADFMADKEKVKLTIERI